MKQWKKFAKYIKNNPTYTLQNDPKVSKKRKKHSKNFERKYGFKYEDVWNLDYTIAHFVLPRLSYLKEIKRGYPADLTVEQWDNYLNRMIRAFEIIVKEDWEIEDYEKLQTEKKDGLILFALYFEYLWD